MWNGSASPEGVAAWVEGLGTWLSSAQSLELIVALLPEEAGLELKVEAPGYPRTTVAQLAREATRSGGTLVELWRMPKAERDAFRATTFGGGTAYRGDERVAVQRALQQHVSMLASRDGAPSTPPINPLEAPSPRSAALLAKISASFGRGAASVPTPPRTQGNDRTAPPPREATSPAGPDATPASPPQAEPHRVPAAAPGSPQRRGRRFAVRLEIEFRTELDFVREHALNISNGGLFVRTAHRPQRDSVVTVDVKLPNGERLQGDALVVHVMDDPYTGGVGLAFLSDDVTFARTLDRYLASLAGGAD